MLTIFLAAALASTGGALSACGDDGNRRLLSPSTASELRSSLAKVEESAVSGDCDAAQQQAATLREQVDSLPREIERDLRLELARGVERLQALVSSRCEPQVEETPTTPAPAPEEPPPDEGAQQDETDEQGQDKGKSEETPPGQEKKPPDGTGGDDSGGTQLTPGEGGGSGGAVP
jgi:hypothetical protein